MFEYLPTNLALYQKYVPVNVTCPACNREEESIYHILVQCHLASQCWMKVLHDVHEGENQDFMQWLSHVYAVTEKDKQSEILTLCWGIWKARNDLVWNQKHTQANNLVSSRSQYLGQWMYARKLSTKTLFQHLVK